MAKRKKVHQTLVEKGRDQIEHEQTESLDNLTKFKIGDPVQYYHDGWHFGHIIAFGTKLRTGMAQIKHPMHAWMIWIQGRDIKSMEETN